MNCAIGWAADNAGGGKVTISAKDEAGKEIYARLFVDGRKIGSSPGIFELPAGMHSLKLISGNIRWDGMVEVIQNQTTGLEAIMKKANPNLTIQDCAEIQVEFPKPFSWPCAKDKCEDTFVQALGIIKDKYHSEYIDYRKLEECSLFGVADAFSEYGLVAERQGETVVLTLTSDQNKGAQKIVDVSNLDRNRLILKHHQVKTFLRKNNPDVFREDKFIYASLVGVLTALDSHSSFLTPDYFNRLAANIGGKFSGLGLEVEKAGEYIEVIKSLNHSPAAKAGILAGDIIVAIEGESCKGISLIEAVKKIRGKQGTIIALTIQRGANAEPQVLNIERGRIEIPSVESKWLAGNIAHVKVLQFNSLTGEALRKNVSKLLEERKPAGWILDLRNNPGGLLTQAGKVADVFLDEGKITYSSSRESNEYLTLYANKEGTLVDDVPLVCIVNEASASASEIVAAALKDHKKAILVGEPTFGKWTVQTVIRLQDGSGLKLTTGKYFSPKGNSFHAKGIKPHIPIKGDCQKAETMNSPAFESECDAQLNGAIEIISDWQIYSDDYLKN